MVPSPAKRLVELAAFFKSLAPRSWLREEKKMEETTVTPSFVILGGPFSYSRRMLRPEGPRVRLEVEEMREMPAIRDWRERAPY